MLRLKHWVVLGGLGAVMGVATAAAAQLLSPNMADVEAMFAPLLPELKQTIPVHLPTYIPDPGDNSRYYATLESADRQGYYIVIGTVPGCDGSDFCRVAEVKGERVTPNTPPLYLADPAPTPAPGAPPLAHSPEKPAPVNLGHGLHGYFFPWVAGNPYRDAAVIWQQGKYRYQVGAKAGVRAEVVHMAESAIQP